MGQWLNTLLDGKGASYKDLLRARRGHRGAPRRRRRARQRVHAGPLPDDRHAALSDTSTRIPLGPIAARRGSPRNARVFRRIADRNIWVIYAEVVLLGVAYGTSIAVLAVHLDAHGIPKLAMGGLAAAFALGIVCLSIPAGWLVQRFGAKATLAAALAGYAVCVTASRSSRRSSASASRASSTARSPSASGSRPRRRCSRAPTRATRGS